MVAMNYIKDMNPGEIRTAALLNIKGSKFIPDYYGEEITWRWVVFPWNFVEDMCNILPKVLGTANSIEEIKKDLKTKFNIEITDKQILDIKEEIKRRESL
jgi:hypoxanthine phosphoribosyltransferase